MTTIDAKPMTGHEIRARCWEATMLHRHGSHCLSIHYGVDGSTRALMVGNPKQIVIVQVIE